MAISYPLTPPATGIARVRFSPAAAVAVTRSPMTFEQQVQARQGQLWVAEIVLRRMARADAEEWVAFQLSLNGQQGTFIQGDPAGATARGSVPGTPLVNGASQTGQVLNTKGWTAGQTNILRMGDYIQLGSGSTSRLHKILKDVNSDGGGLAALDIWPRLRTSPADNAAVTAASCKGLWRLASNQMEWDIDELAIYGQSFACMEAL